MPEWKEAKSEKDLRNQEDEEEKAQKISVTAVLINLRKKDILNMTLGAVHKLCHLFFLPF